MEIHRLRYFPAGRDVARICRERKLAAEAARPLADETYEACSRGSPICTCDGERCLKGVFGGCRIVQGTEEAEEGGWVCWSMGTGACYVPMLEEGWEGSFNHRLAILGSSTFKQLSRCILAEPSSIVSRDSAGNTLLLLACCAYEQNLDVIEFLLKQCPEGFINARNIEGMTALHFAVLNHRPDIVELLLNNGADVNTGIIQLDGAMFGLTPDDTKYGLTPLHISMYLSSDDCMKLLIHHGADITVKVAKALNPIHGAKLRCECLCGGCWSFSKHGFRNLIPPAVIEEAPVPLVTRGRAFNIAVERGDTSKASFLLERFAKEGSIDIDRCDGVGMTPLARACVIAKTSTIKLLVSYGADPNVTAAVYKNSKDVPPLHILMMHNRALAGEFVCTCCQKVVLCEESALDESFDALLASDKINVHQKNRRGRSAFLEAVSRGHDRACRELLRMGADPVKTDRKGYSAIFLACQLQPEQDRLGVLACLLSAGVSHDIEAKNASIAGLVYNSTDRTTLTMLNNAGVFGRKDLDYLWREAKSRPAPATEQEAKDEDKYCAKVKELYSTPRSLLQSCLLHFSRRVGKGSPDERAEKLKELLADPQVDSKVEVGPGVFTDSVEKSDSHNNENFADVICDDESLGKKMTVIDPRGSEAEKYAVWNMMKDNFRELHLI